MGHPREDDRTMTSGYSGTPLPKKLGIVGDAIFTVRHAPDGFAITLGDIGDAVWQQSLLAPLDVVIAFHRQRSALATEWPKLTAAVEPDGAVWVAWPKKASGVPTDITEDVLRAQLLRTGWVDNKVCAIDEVWSGLRFVLRKELRRPKDNAKRGR
ncbi:MAG: hypothetical protein FD127_780 [Acidimicrobiaceae bacterium]|jgi:hypothetical protein|nr:MAG: hypothetical protein FD127_780 [Acidimicrobiaceae bacterium]